MRKVCAVGEIVLDIVFENGQPSGAYPGGSMFNSLVSLARCGLCVSMISYIGCDKTGKMILEFMKENNINSEQVVCTELIKTPVALAFLNNNKDAEYSFYKSEVSDIIIDCPDITMGDVFLFGSYFSINERNKSIIENCINKATKCKSIIYYDPNFRRAHLDDMPALLPILAGNIRKSDIIRASSEDFELTFGTSNPNDLINLLGLHDKVLIITNAGGKVSLCTPLFTTEYSVPQIEVKSTIGAGDAFNAGIIYSLIELEICQRDLIDLPEDKWEIIISNAIKFAAEVCKSNSNYIGINFKP